MRFLAILFCLYCVSAKLPHYIKPCARSDPNFNACAVQHANENIKELIKGDLKNGIPVMDPLDIKKIDIDVNGFHLTVKDIQVIGLKDIVIINADYDFKSQKYNIKMKWPRGEIVGDYEASGKLLVLPISGKGKINGTLINSVTDSSGSLSFETINGKKYLHASAPQSKAQTSRLYLRFSNLFNGNKLLEDEVNRFLDENWKDVHEELSRPGTDAILKILVDNINKIYRTAPYDEMFPETLP